MTAEEIVRSSLARGEAASFKGVSDNTVTAAFLRGLIVECLTNLAVAPAGIVVADAVIDGDLSCAGFASAGNALPGLNLAGCYIKGKLNLADSHWAWIDLNDCTLSGLSAPRLKVDHGLRANRLKILGESTSLVDLHGLISGSDIELEHLGRGEAPCAVALRRSRIRGGLTLSGARLKYLGPEKGRDALEMSEAEVMAGVFLSSSPTHRFEADGVVSLRGAKLGGTVQCAGARLTNVDGDTLSMDGAEVTGSVYLRPLHGSRFESHGVVSLLSTKIGIVLDCSGAQLKASRNIATGDSIALAMDGIEVKSSIFLREAVDPEAFPFEAEGEVRLQAAKIGSGLDCCGAQLSNPDGHALLMEVAEVAIDVDLTSSEHHPFKADGSIDLRGCNIKGAFNCEGRITSSDTAIDLSSCRIGGALHVRLLPTSRGAVSVRGTRAAELDDWAGTGWGPEPRIGGQGHTGVLLRLDGFTYDRLGKWERPPPPEGLSRLPWLFRRALGQGTEQDIWWNRTRWLDRQYVGEKPCEEDFFPQPHEQLTHILRLMGHNYDARRIANHKFLHESRCGADEFLSRFFMYPYRWFFGCDYLPTRALVTAVAWLLIGWALVSVALERSAPRDIVFVKAATSVEIVRNLSDPDVVPKSPTPVDGRDRKILGGYVFEAHKKVAVRDVPCSGISPLLYALDSMLPVVRLRMEERCEMADDAPWWRFGRAIYAVLGWVIVGLAALTWSGVLQRDLK